VRHHKFDSWQRRCVPRSARFFPRRRRAIRTCIRQHLRRLRPFSPPPPCDPAAARPRPSSPPPPGGPAAARVAPFGARSPPPPRRRRLAPRPPNGPRGPSSSRRSAAAATSSPPRCLPAHPPPRPPLVRAQPKWPVRCGDGAVLTLEVVYRLSQIVNEIRDDLADFKCGMAHLFCMYLFILYAIHFFLCMIDLVYGNFTLSVTENT
jgi:hypothetical protein